MPDWQTGTWADALAEEIQSGHPGVRLQLGLDRGPYLVLFWVLVPESERGKGIGTRVMERITAAADLRGVPVTLSPSGTFGGDPDRLDTFYRRFGFVTNASRGGFGAAGESMVRAPRGPAAAGDGRDQWSDRLGRWASTPLRYRCERFLRPCSKNVTAVWTV
ncbi:GNAT family N-acetyltransferase [Streptomyces antibioticus]|uniref:GNAT family N-acetyltransferase n=1 Tax=Streptomyces antibioticus TaxID=1890 RepID=UPI0033F23138